ncbi:RteC domain-containing protein [Alistipes sp.]|uniref:RteC domain-containing protein n=1 Tax=Alistipes sp. TaxID=1872444 RepID=UPI003AB3D6E8
MNTLMQEGLFSLLEKAACNPCMPIEAAAYEAAFEAFALEAARMTDASCTPRMLRTIERARLEAAGLLRLFSRRGNDAPLARHYCLKVLDTLDAERRLLLLRVRHPTFAEPEATTRCSPLFLNDGFRATDLVELIVPLYEIQFCRSVGNNATTVRNIVLVFEWAFNTPIPNYDGLRSNVLNRKKQLTPLLDRMREALTDLSQR